MIGKNSNSLVTHYREVFLLALASPMIAELLSSSAPPLEFFIPWIFVLFVTFYGCCAVLIREFTLRRGSGWRGILLLGAAFAILQEGMATRVFFDPKARPLGPLAEHGLRWLGVNWIWTLDGIAYHAVFSVALPILLLYQLFPNSRNVPWLGRRGLSVVAVLCALSTWVFLEKGGSYAVPKSYLYACLLCIVVLFVLASRRAPRPTTAPLSKVSPVWFAALGFAATAGQLTQIYVIPLFAPSAWITLVFFAALVFTSGKLLMAWSGSGATWNRSQQSALLAGALGCFGLLAFTHEFNPTRTYDATGMWLVGAITLAGLAWMWRRAGKEAACQAESTGPSSQSSTPS